MAIPRLGRCFMRSCSELWSIHLLSHSGTVFAFLNQGNAQVRLSSLTGGTYKTNYKGLLQNQPCYSKVLEETELSGPFSIPDFLGEQHGRILSYEGKVFLMYLFFGTV